MTNKYKLGALAGFMEIPPGSREDQRHKQGTFFTPWSYLAPDYPDFKAFFIFHPPSSLRIFNWVRCLGFCVAHARSHTFTVLLFFPILTFKRLRAAAPVANWRCQFAKFSSRVQIEPNARMLVNNKNAAIKSEVNCSNPKQCHTLREVGK